MLLRHYFLWNGRMGPAPKQIPCVTVFQQSLARTRQTGRHRTTRHGTGCEEKRKRRRQCGKNKSLPRPSTAVNHALPEEPLSETAPGPPSPRFSTPRIRTCPGHSNHALTLGDDTARRAWIEDGDGRARGMWALAACVPQAYARATEQRRQALREADFPLPA